MFDNADTIAELELKQLALMLALIDNGVITEEQLDAALSKADAMIQAEVDKQIEEFKKRIERLKEVK